MWSLEVVARRVRDAVVVFRIARCGRQNVYGRGAVVMSGKTHCTPRDRRRRGARVVAMASENRLAPPVWLEKHAVDLFEVDGLGSIAHGFEQRCAWRSTPSVERTMRPRFGREDAVGERGAVELGDDESGASLLTSTE